MLGLDTTPHRVLSPVEIQILMDMRKPRGERQTCAEWARAHHRAGAPLEWSVYGGSMQMWWKHAEGDGLREAKLLAIARDWWWAKGGAVSKLAVSTEEWRPALAQKLVTELDPLFGGWNGYIWRDGGKLVMWNEALGKAQLSPVTPIAGPEPVPPHGTHLRASVGCPCLACETAAQAVKRVKREAGRPKGSVKKK